MRKDKLLLIVVTLFLCSCSEAFESNLKLECTNEEFFFNSLGYYKGNEKGVSMYLPSHSSVSHETHQNNYIEELKYDIYNINQVKSDGKKKLTSSLWVARHYYKQYLMLINYIENMNSPCDQQIQFGSMNEDLTDALLLLFGAPEKITKIYIDIDRRSLIVFDSLGNLRQVSSKNGDKVASVQIIYAEN